MASALAGKEGVCLLEVVSAEWSWQQPWKRLKQNRSTGSGFVISGRRILTNAHVVKSAIDIRVRRHGSPRRFLAEVAVYAPDVDLALVTLRGEANANDFFEGRTDVNGMSNDDSANDGPGGGGGTDTDTDGAAGRPRETDSVRALEFATGLPALQENVHVVGFPTGGRTICVTEGIVSRIDNVWLADKRNTVLAIQIDAAINPGNSGGPAFNGAGLVTGVAFCKSGGKNTDNIGYVIAAQVVQAFLGRCHADGTYTLSPSVPYRWHSLENRSLRLAHGVPDDLHGILLTDVSPTVPALRKNDVLTKIDGVPIADDGQVFLRSDELIQHRYLLRGKRVDEPTTFSVYRDGAHIEHPPCVLGDIANICLRWADVEHMPDYLILGALVLVPLTYNLSNFKEAGTRLVASVDDWCERWPGDWDGNESLVAIVDIFAHELSFSYVRKWRRVVAYNDTPVRSLRHLRDMWERSCEAVTSAPEGSPPTFARIALEHDDDVVFEVKAAIDAQAEILETHRIAKASVISEPNPKYRLIANDTGTKFEHTGDGAKRHKIR